MKSKKESVEVFGAILLAIMFVLMIVQVVSRYVFRNPISWTEEISRFLLVWISFIGAVIAAKKNQHVRFDYVINLLPKGIKNVVSIIANATVLIFLSITIIAGSILMIQGHSIPSVTSEHIKWSYVYASLPIGFLLLAMDCVKKMIKP